MKKLKRVLAVNVLVVISVTLLFSLSFAADIIKPPITAPVKLPINIDPLNQNRCMPVNFTSQSPLPPGTVGQQKYEYQLQASGGKGAITFKIISGSLPPGLNLSSNGLITGKILACGGIHTSDSQGDYTFKVKATDSCPAGSLSVDETFSLKVNRTCYPMITSIHFDLPNGFVGQHYKYQFQVQGAPPYTFKITKGALPQGLSLNSTGEISGIPTTVERDKNHFVISMSDSCSDFICINNTESYRARTFSTEELHINVWPPCKALTFTSPDVLPQATLGQYYNQWLGANNGGDFMITISILLGSSLPPGLKLDEYMGSVFGTPTTAGNYSFRVRATDTCYSGKQSVDNIFSLTVK